MACFYCEIILLYDSLLSMSTFTEKSSYLQNKLLKNEQEVFFLVEKKRFYKINRAEESGRSFP